MWQSPRVKLPLELAFTAVIGTWFLITYSVSIYGLWVSWRSGLSPFLIMWRNDYCLLRAHFRDGRHVSFQIAGDPVLFGICGNRSRHDPKSAPSLDDS